MKQEKEKGKRSINFRNKLKRRSFIPAFVLMIAFGVVGVLALRGSFAASVITGRVYDTRTNLGIKGVVIFACNSNGQATTDVNGKWTLTLVNSGYCARPISGVPSGWSGPKTNTSSDHPNYPTYEEQVYGINCFHNPSCATQFQAWDRAVDTGIDFGYTSPTPPPTINSFSASPQTITVGSSSQLSWTSTGSSSCTLSYGTTHTTEPGNGGTIVKPGSTTTYSLTCSNAGGNSSPKTQTITVNAAPGGTPPKTTPPKTTTTKPKTTSPSTAAAAADTISPTVPQNFAAAVDSTNLTIHLSWQASTDNVGVTSYQLERSTDTQQSWDLIGNNITQTNFDDLTAGFGVTYYYRLKALDAAGNVSDYAATNIAASNFVANAKSGSEVNLTSDDKVVSINIPAGGLSQDAFCSIVTPSDVQPPAKYVIVSGPYQLNCRDASGTLITSFSKPFVLSAKVDSSKLAGIKQIIYMGQKDDGSWQNLKVTKHDKKSSTDTVSLENFSTFVIMGSKKKTPLLVKILEILAVLVALLLIARFIVRRLLVHKAEDEYDEYLRKAKGL